MPRVRLAQLVSCLGLVALVAGCARQSPNIASDASGPIAAALSPASNNLTGTWRGSFTQVGAVLYIDDGDVVLQTMGSGTVVRSGNRITLRSSQGPWLTLVRSGNTLYGVAEDPLVEATIMLRLEREGSTG